jgi:hypothetical protein
MRYKLTTSFALTLSLSIATLVTPAVAATKSVVKVGVKCLNRHAATKVGDKYFVCTLLNSKMTWQPSVTAIEKSIWTDLQSRRNAQGEIKTTLDIHYSPTVNRQFTDAILAGVNSAAKLWQKQYLPKTPLPTFFFSERDRQWFIDETKASNLFSEEQLSHFDDEVSRNGDRASWAGITGTNGQIWMLFMVGSGRTDLDRNVAEVPAHEYTHLAQFSIAESNQDELTCWQVEGGAAFYGTYLGSNSPQELLNSTKERNSDPGFKGFPGMINTPSNQFENILDKLGPRYNHNECGPDGAYSIGSTAHEYLYTLKGHDGIITLLKSVSTLGDYQKAVEATYGKPWPVLRKEIANYIRLVVAQN